MCTLAPERSAIDNVLRFADGQSRLQAAVVVGGEDQSTLLVVGASDVTDLDLTKGVVAVVFKDDLGLALTVAVLCGAVLQGDVRLLPRLPSALDLEHGARVDVANADPASASHDVEGVGSGGVDASNRQPRVTAGALAAKLKRLEVLAPFPASSSSRQSFEFLTTSLVEETNDESAPDGVMVRSPPESTPNVA